MPENSVGNAGVWIEAERSFVTHDGLRLVGTAVVPGAAPTQAILLLHGEGADRDQFGFYARLAAELGDAGVASLRFDLPGHGASEGGQTDLTLSGLLNVIDAGVRYLRTLMVGASVSLLATGVTGGVAAGYAARRGEIGRLVLINPLIDYQQYFIGQDPRWDDDSLSAAASRELLATGRLEYPAITLGRAMLNEVFWLQPRTVLSTVGAPTLIVHGAGPTPVPAESSRTAAAALTCTHRLVEFNGPQRYEWRAPTIRIVIRWILSED